MEDFEILAIRTKCSRFQLACQDVELDLDKIENGFLKIGVDLSFNYLIVKIQKYFKKQKRSNFERNLTRRWIFWKSKQIITEKINRGCDIFGKGDQKLKYGLKILIILYTYEPGTFTNWQNWILTKTRPGIHLRASFGILAQYLLNFWKN